MRWWDQCLLYFKLLSKLLTGRGKGGERKVSGYSRSQEMLAQKTCLTLSTKSNYNSYGPNMNLILSINLYTILLYDRWDTNVDLILLCSYSVSYKNIFSVFLQNLTAPCAVGWAPSTHTHTPPTKCPQTFYWSEFGSDNSCSGLGWGLSGRFGVTRQLCCWQQHSPAQYIWRTKKNLKIFTSLSLYFSHMMLPSQELHLPFFYPPQKNSFFSLQDCQHITHVLQLSNGKRSHPYVHLN